MIKRNSLNFLTDLITATVLIAMILTGLTLRWVLPPGSRGGSGRLLWGLDRHGWGDIHFWLSIGLLALLLVHVTLHWQWVCATALRCVPGSVRNGGAVSAGRRNVLGVAMAAALIAVVGGFVWLAMANLTTAPGAERPSASHVAGEAAPPRFDIRGSMTLAEVAAAHQLSLDDLRQRLELPASVPPDQRVGQLRQFSVTVADVRAAVNAMESARQARR